MEQACCLHVLSHVLTNEYYVARLRQWKSGKKRKMLPKLHFESRELLILERSIMKLPLRRQEQDARDAWALLFTCPVSPKDSFFGL